MVEIRGIGPALKRNCPTKIAISGVGLAEGQEIIVKRGIDTWKGTIPKDSKIAVDEGISYTVVEVSYVKKDPIVEGEDVGSVTVTISGSETPITDTGFIDP